LIQEGDSISTNYKNIEKSDMSILSSFQKSSGKSTAFSIIPHMDHDASIIFQLSSDLDVMKEVSIGFFLQSSLTSGEDQTYKIFPISYQDEQFQLFGNGIFSAGVRNTTDGTGAMVCTRGNKSESNNLIVKSEYNILPLSNGTVVHMVYHAVAGAFVIYLNHDTVGIYFHIAENLAEVTKSSKLNKPILGFAVTLGTNQSATVLQPEILQSKSGSQDNHEKDMLTDLTPPSPLKNENDSNASLTQVISSFDPELTDKRLELTSDDSTVYYPTGSSETDDNVEPIAARRLTSPRCSFSVMLSRNVLIQGLVSIGLARVFPSQNGSPNPSDYIKKFFHSKCAFGVEKNSWGIFDLRKGNNLMNMTGS
jgi:hypothetical protein